MRVNQSHNNYKPDLNLSIDSDNKFDNFYTQPIPFNEFKSESERGNGRVNVFENEQERTRLMSKTHISTNNLNNKNVQLENSLKMREKNNYTVQNKVDYRPKEDQIYLKNKINDFQNIIHNSNNEFINKKTEMSFKIPQNDFSKTLNVLKDTSFCNDVNIKNSFPYLKLFPFLCNVLKDNVSKDDVLGFLKTNVCIKNIYFSKFLAGPFINKLNGDVIIELFNQRDYDYVLKLNGTVYNNCLINVVFPSFQEVETVKWQYQQAFFKIENINETIPNSNLTTQVPFSALTRKKGDTIVDYAQNNFENKTVQVIKNRGEGGCFVEFSKVPSNIKDEEMLEYIKGYEYIERSLISHKSKYRGPFNDWTIRFKSREEANRAMNNLKNKCIRNNLIQLTMF